MREQADRPDLAFMDRVHLSFALGKALEDEGAYAESFAQYDAETISNVRRRATARRR